MAKFKVNNRALTDCIGEAKTFLGNDNYDLMLKEYAFIELLSKLENFQIQSPTLHWLVPRGSVETNNSPTKRTLKFDISGHSHTFGHVEFALITGLSFGEYPNCDEETQTPFKTFLNTMSLKFIDLKAKIDVEAVNNPDGIFMRKLIVLYIIHSMVFVKEDRNVVHPRAICLADDPELFNSYPWGRMVYEEMVKEWASFFEKKKKPGMHHLRIGTFPFAIQAWVLECLLPDFAAVLARRLPGNPLPRILRWDTSKDLGGYTLAKQTIYDAEDLTFKRITPEVAELDKACYKGVVSYLEYKPGQGYPTFPSGTEDDENVPGFLNLTLAMKRLENKIDRNFQRFEERLSKLEDKVFRSENVGVDSKRMEMETAKRVRNMFKYEFEVAKFEMETQLRAQLNLPPSEKERPKVFEVVGDKIVEELPRSGVDGPVVSEDHTVGATEFEDPPMHDNEFEEPPMHGNEFEEPPKHGDDEDQTMHVNDDEPPINDLVIGVRPIRLKRRAPAVVSPFVKVKPSTRKKKCVKKENIDPAIVQPNASIDLLVDLPLVPYEPVTDRAYNTTKYQPMHGNDDEPPMNDLVIGVRPIRLKRPAPAVVSPFVKVEPSTRKKKCVKKENIDPAIVQPNASIDLLVDLPLVHPYDPVTDRAYNTTKYQLVRTWLSKNATRAQVAALVPIVPMLDYISYNSLEVLVSPTGWLPSEVIDGHLQLLNMQREEYPSVFTSTKWTCLGSLYCKAVKYGYNLFVKNRMMYATKGLAGAEVPWEAMDMDLCKYVSGMSENWGTKAWNSCDQIYGVENIANTHWAAYSYDFAEKVVRVYDSMSTAYQAERQEVFGMHATIAPSLYNYGLQDGEEKMDDDIPFGITIVDVPQQPNSCDCGVYAIKFIQCLAMKVDFHGLVATDFGNFRRKLAVDLIKWSKTSSGRYAFDEKVVN